MQQNCSLYSKTRKHHISRMVRHCPLTSLPVEGRVFVEYLPRHVSICLRSSHNWVLSIPFLGTNQLCLLSSIIDNSTELGWGASTLSLKVTLVNFFPLCTALLWSVSFPPASEEKTTSHRTSLPKVMQCSNVIPEPKSSARPLEQAKCRMLLSEYHPREWPFQKNHMQLLSEILTHSWGLFSPQVQMLNLHQIQKFWTKDWLNSLVSTSLMWNGQAVFEESHARPWWSPR